MLRKICFIDSTPHWFCYIKYIPALCLRFVWLDFAEKKCYRHADCKIFLNSTSAKVNDSVNIFFFKVTTWNNNTTQCLNLVNLKKKHILLTLVIIHQMKIYEINIIGWYQLSLKIKGMTAESQYFGGAFKYVGLVKILFFLQFKAT